MKRRVVAARGRCLVKRSNKCCLHRCHHRRARRLLGACPTHRRSRCQIMSARIRSAGASARPQHVRRSTTPPVQPDAPRSRSPAKITLAQMCTPGLRDARLGPLAASRIVAVGLRGRQWQPLAVGRARRGARRVVQRSLSAPYSCLLHPRKTVLRATLKLGLLGPSLQMQPQGGPTSLPSSSWSGFCRQRVLCFVDALPWHPSSCRCAGRSGVAWVLAALALQA